MKKEKTSDLHDALRSIIDERRPATDRWQQTVLATLDKNKTRQRLWWGGIAAAAAVAAVIITMAYFSRTPVEENNVTYSEVIPPALPPEADSQPTPERVIPSGVETATLLETRRTRKSESAPTPDPIIIFDTYDQAYLDNPGPDNDLLPEEWIEDLISSELTNRYLTMISTPDLEDDNSDTTEL